MSRSHIYDNWEGLVTATVRRYQDEQLCYADSISSSFTSASSSSDLANPASTVDVSAIDQLIGQESPDDQEHISSANNHLVDHVLKPPKIPTTAQIGKIVGAALRFVTPARMRPQSQMMNLPPDAIATARFESSDLEMEASEDGRQGQIAANTFTFRELATATKNFRADYLLGEGPGGKVYKGILGSTNKIVVIKQLDIRDGSQGNRGFLVELLMLGLLHHPNVINLIGYCADGNHRLEVYEYMPLGTLEHHLHNLPPDIKRLDWNARMKIAAGTAKGLEFLHDRANPPVIHRNIKPSNILLDNGYHPKISDFRLAKLGPVGDKEFVSTRAMGTYGYCAPEYAMTGQLTLKADVYSFGVVLLEIISGRKAIDDSKPVGEQNVVAWARPLFRDRRRFSQITDPMLQGQYPVRSLYQALAVAAMCLQEQPNGRPQWEM